VTAADEEIELPAPRSNRPVTLLHRVEYGLALAFGGIFRLIGVDAASALAGRFMRVIGPFIGVIHRRGVTNLRIAFPDWSDDKIETTLREAWENIGRTAGEFSHLEKFDPGEGGRIEIVNREAFSAVIASGKPAVFVSGHFANWEVTPRTMHAAGVDYCFVYRAANNPLVDGLIIRTRGAVMSRRQIPKGRRGGRGMLEALSEGVSLAMYVDQKLNSGGIPSPLFGRPAMTGTAAARMALRFGAPVIPVDLVRLGGARFRMTVGAPLEFKASGDIAADVEALTARINVEIERMVRQAPGQWLWFHRRWGKDAAP
jgi:KDO2-lipid IV(A) lauroyltransferase